MKTTAWSSMMVVGLSALLTAPVYRAWAEDAPAATAKADKTWTGTIESVNPQDRTLKVKGLLWSRRFNLGGSCAYMLLDKSQGAIGDLRPGEKVMVSYQVANGVRVADQVRQEPMSCTGRVKNMDPTAHTLTLQSDLVDRKFQVADDCRVVLRGGKSGSWADVQPGEEVTVTYETPRGTMTAREIAQTSTQFTGELTAIDLDRRTLKARGTFSTRKFMVGDDCAIVINGKSGGTLSDLQPGRDFTFNYDEVNGVDIVNRIASASAQQAETTASLSPP
ncbi:MAG: hypothetical protein KGR98_09335 [Verrucomicrobia bacterium]|nr:hypothetical protein [Verrucomicrobiota bacterium]